MAAPFIVIGPLILSIFISPWALTTLWFSRWWYRESDMIDQAEAKKAIDELLGEVNL